MTIAGIYAVLIAALVGTFIGWVVAHDEVGRECQRLGGFYVGNTTYECKKATP